MGYYKMGDGLIHMKQIPYPTIDGVKVAGRHQLGYWFRFLPSPGMNWVDTETFEINLEREKAIMHLICDRFEEFGGMDSNLSKELGWVL
jgi:hypothetical protein